MSLLRIWLALVVLSIVLIILHSNSLLTDVALEESTIQKLESSDVEINSENYDLLIPASTRATNVVVP